MIDISKKADLNSVLNQEKIIVNYYNEFESNVKDSLETYIEEFKDVTFDNEVFKTMLLNNFASAIIQVDNNLQNIQSLSNILEILEKQDSVSETDIDTYNKLASKVEKDIELLQNFLSQTISSFENVPINGKKKSINTLNKCKEKMLKKFDLSTIEESKKEVQSKTTSKKPSKAIKKKMDLSSSDLLCFFPKNKSDSLVISTVQENYRISYQNEVATIYIEDEDFNISLKTAGVQISNSNNNNILYVSQADHKYTIITNGQIEIPTFIQISKISKNDDFLEVEISNPSLSLYIEDSVINFENTITPSIIETKSQAKPQAKPQTKPEINIQPEIQNKVEPQAQSSAAAPEKVDSIFGHLEDLHEMENIDSSNAEETKQPEKNKIYEPIPTKEVAETVEKSNIKIQSAENENEVQDNNTLIISDSNQNVVLPYRVIELEEKLKSNKKYKSLQDVIKNEYTLPLETFKNPTKSRFREAFQLIKKKEHGSLKEAIELGFELMFQSDLNPAVIAACKDLDELDIYLDCLDDNELDKFSCFKIEYNVPPTKKGKKK